MPPEQLFILPGEMAFLREPGTITTLLGSCVSVCLWDRLRGWGGLNHYMVAEQTGGLPPGKVGIPAIDGLVQLATLAGSSLSSLQARLVGGASVISSVTSGSAALLGDIGKRNVQVAERRLADLGIKIVQKEVGGDHGRRLRMDTKTGTIVATEMQRSLAADRPVIRHGPGNKAGVLVIDDSPLVRQLLSGAINASGDLEVVGEAEDPFMARERILELDPDVLCLDLIMPKLDGLSFLRRLMQYKPIPTVVVSTIAKAGSKMRAQVIEAGAIDAIDKESLNFYADPAAARGILLPALRRAAGTPVSARHRGVIA